MKLTKTQYALIAAIRNAPVDGIHRYHLVGRTSKRAKWDDLDERKVAALHGLKDLIFVRETDKFVTMTATGERFMATEGGAK